jgi:F0F1-type ATP synthase delta subunit
LERRTIGLLPLVLNSLLQEFWRRRHVLHFNINSSHILEAGEQERIIKFLAEKTGAVEIKAKFSIDASLICGINMQSNLYKFEHSVAQELKKFKESLLERVQL